MTSSDEIFLIRERELSSLPARQMREGLFGKTLEDALQTLLSRYPELLPGSQFVPDSEDPPRFFLLRREMPVGSWSLDHLYVDQYGVLTLVETKLIQNPESRREVIGQIVEYAANAADRWGDGKTRQLASDYYSSKGRSLEDELESFFGASYEDEAFWDRIESNLQAGKIRLVIASDGLRPEVIKMIEYLNAEMRNADLIGLELRCYGSGDDEYVLAPRVVGQSVTIAERKASSRQRVKWTESLLREFIAQELDGERRSRYEHLLNLAIEKNAFAESTGLQPGFGLFGQTGKRTIWVEPGGTVYFVLKPGRYPNIDRDRDYVVEQLKMANLVDQNLNAEEVVDGRSTNTSIHEMNSKQFKTLIELVEQAIT